MQIQRFARLVLFLVLVLCATACQPTSDASVAYNTGIRVWLDQPPSGASMPLGAFTLRAHARDVNGGGVERIVFFVNTLSLGTINTDATQSLVSAETVWNPSVEGEYRIQAQAFGRGGSAMSELVVVCVGNNCPANANVLPTPIQAVSSSSQATCKGTPVINSFTSSAATVLAGENVTVSWNVANADVVELSGIGRVSAIGSATIPVKEATALTLFAMCGGKENSATKSMNIAVTTNPVSPTGCSGKPVIASFTASPTTFTAGASTTLRWSVTNASEVGLTGIGVVPATGSQVVSPRTTTTYSIIALCNTKDTMVDRSIVVTVVAAPTPTVVTATRAPVPSTPTRTPTAIVSPQPQGCNGTPNISSFTASPSTISPGQSVTLNWGAITNADSVEIDRGIGGVPSPGSTTVSPSGTTIYTLTARCKGTAVTRQVQVSVQGVQPPAQDTTPPSMGGYTLSAKSVYYITGCGANTVTITTSATDASGIASVQLTYRYVGKTAGNWKTVTMNSVGGGAYSVTINVGNEAYATLGGAKGTLEFYATGRDVPGNSANGSNFSVEVAFCPG